MSCKFLMLLYDHCLVDGGYTPWSSYGPCSEKCGDGVKERTRSCTRPAPAHGGKLCAGPVTEVAPCLIKHCPGSLKKLRNQKHQELLSA